MSFEVSEKSLLPAHALCCTVDLEIRIEGLKPWRKGKERESPAFSS